MRNIAHGIFLLLSLSQIKSAIAEPCESANKGNAAFVTFKTLLPAVQSFLASNVEDFCQETLLEDGLQSLSRDHQLGDLSEWELAQITRSPQDMSGALREVLSKKASGPKKFALGPWESQLIPNATARTEAFFNHPILFGEWKFRSINEVSSFLSGDSRQALPEGIYTLAEIQGSRKLQLADGKDLKIGFLPKAILCNELVSLTQIGKCADGIDRILEWMAPRETDFRQSRGAGTAWTLTSELNEVLTDPIYREPLSSAAVKMIRRVQSKQPSPSNFFDDIHQSFLESGLSKDQSLDRTWKIMAVIATAGANISGRLRLIKAGQDSDRVKVALSVLSSGASILDSRSKGSGRIYSYPSNVRTVCNYGKSYHFWMAAYLARKIAIESHDPRAAAAASYILEKGYQMRKKTGAARDPARQFMMHTFDPYNNSIRIDLSFAAAGALYGARSVKSPSKTKIQLDGAIQEIVRSSAVQNTLSREEVDELWKGTGYSGFQRWNQQFAPNSVFRFLE